MYCKYVTRKNYKRSTKTTIVTSQYASQITEAQIYSKLHNNNIFIHERKCTFNKRLCVTKSKAKNHKLNKFLMFPLEGKSCNPANMSIKIF